MSGGSSAAALARLADLDAAASHGGHVGPEVIALHDHEAEPVAVREKLEETPAGARG